MTDKLREHVEAMSREDLEAATERYYRLIMQSKDMFHPFICSPMGGQGADGLHDGYLIVPAPGADFFVHYVRKEDTE